MTGIELIAAERARQVSEEGYTAAHDDNHYNQELPNAALAFILNAMGYHVSAENQWPFEEPFEGSVDPMNDYAKGAALIAAEIDRLQRLKP